MKRFHTQVGVQEEVGLLEEKEKPLNLLFEGPGLDRLVNSLARTSLLKSGSNLFVNFLWISANICEYLRIPAKSPGFLRKLGCVFQVTVCLHGQKDI